MPGQPHSPRCLPRASPRPALRRRRRAERRRAVAAVGRPVRGHPAVDRRRARDGAGVLAPPLRQDDARSGRWRSSCRSPLHYGVDLAAREVVHTLLAEYVPFIVLLFALFTVSGGIHIRGNLHGSPALNTGLLGARHGAGQRDGHDRRVDAADPAAAARQRQPAPQARTWSSSSSSSSPTSAAR